MFLTRLTQNLSREMTSRKVKSSCPYWISSHLDKSFMRWMQLLVTYLKIGFFCIYLQKLNISPVTAIQPSGVDHEMEPWDKLLKSRHLHFPQDLNVNIVIEAIKNEVKTRLGESCHNIFQKFQLQAFQPEFLGNLHCEIILAVLVQHAQDPVTSSTLGCLAQVWLSLHSNNIHQLNGLCRIWMNPSFRWSFLQCSCHTRFLSKYWKK